MTEKEFDMARIVIIGAGHNGLVCANYLARAGHSVQIFEQSRFLGGAARSDKETFPGYTLSSFSYVCSLFLEKIVKELDLRSHGYEVLKRDPAFFKPLPNERFLLLGGDKEENARQIGKFSPRDAESFTRFSTAYGALGEFFEKFLLETPPALPPRSMDDVRAWLRVAERTLALGPMGDARLLDLFVSDARTIVSRWFESDVIRSAMLPDSTVGALQMTGPLLVLHNSMGEAAGERGVWGFHRGGMGGIARALADAGLAQGVKIELNQPVGFVRINKSGTAVGVYLENGESVPADIVISNATPHETFMRLVPRGECPPAYAKRVRGDDYSSGVMKVNAVLSGLPQFRALDGVDNPAKCLTGTIHLSPSTPYIKRALADALDGRPSRRPMMEITLPSLVDDTLAPQGHHVMGMFVQYAPYHLKEGEWSSARKEQYFRENVLGTLREYVSNIDDILVDAQVFSPVDLYRELRLTGGNIFHGALTPSQLYCFRHVYRTPIQGLWLCGAGTHPGGGVMGACGHNAARDIIKSLE